MPKARRLKRGAFEFSITTAVVMILSVAILILGIALLNSLKVELPKVEKGMPQFFSLYSVPEKAEQGTLFKLRVETKNASFIYLMKAGIMKDNELIYSVQMYDDGMHNDGKEKDGIYAGTFDSSGQKEGIYSINLIINPGETEAVYENVSRLMIFRNSCVPLFYSGSPEDRIDVAILPSDYNDLSKFKSDALKLIDFSGSKGGLFSYEPFSSSKGRFNFYIINSTEDLECSRNCQNIPSLVCCNDEKVSKTASQCPSDYIFVLIDSKEFCGTASYYAKVCNGWNLGQVGVHEFGHAFGGLGDEYDYQKVYPQYKVQEAIYPNCDVEKCPKWKSFWSGCFMGCGLSASFRPTDKGCIMYSYTDSFDAVCKKAISGLMANYEKISPAPPPSPSQNSYVIDLEYGQEKIRAKDVYVSPAASPDRKALRKVDYVGKIISADEKNLHTFKFEMPNILWPAMPRENEASYSPVMLDSFNHTILAPYFNNSKAIEVYNLQNQKVLSIDVGYLSKTCGNGICDEHETAMDCPQDCKADMKDGLCNYAKDNVCDPDCPKADPDCRKLDIRMAAIIAVLAIVTASLLLRKKH